MSCYATQGCKCEGEERHAGWEECRKLVTTIRREARQRRNVNGGAAAKPRKVRVLSEDELMKLRRDVGLI